ncbi:MAG: metal-dependent hydrolase [Alphaproteobacteria bacterium]
MDSITHGLLGATTAQLGFRQTVGRDATWVAVGAAIMPDLDILVMPFLALTGAEVDGLTPMAVHRGLSHSLLAAPLLALPIAVAWWWLRQRARRNRQSVAGHTGRSPSFRLLYACVLVAVVSHDLLDWCTSYGTQLLAPLSRTRYAIDAVPIVDIIYTPLLILTLLACYFVRRLRGGHATRATLIIGLAGMLASAGYLAAGRGMHDWAVRKAIAAAEDRPGKVIRADAYPALGTIFLWRTVVETDRQWIVTRIHHFSREPAAAWRSRVAGKSDGPWVAKARQLKQVRTFDWFAGGRLRAEHATTNDGHIVTFHDMRYAWPIESADSIWPLTVMFDRDGRVTYVGRRHDGPSGSFRSLVARIWSDIWNP